MLVKLIVIILAVGLSGCIKQCPPRTALPAAGGSGSFASIAVEDLPKSPDAAAGTSGTLIIASKTGEVADLVDGKCSICMKEHQKSTVVMNAYGSATAMFCGSGQYDENGKYTLPEPCNTMTVEGQCSRGHHIVHTEKHL